MAQKIPTNLIYSVQKDVCDILNTTELSAIDFFPENNRDIETQIQTALRKQGICGIVLSPTLNYIGDLNAQQLAFEFPDLTIQVVENVIVNRSKQNTKYVGTAEDVAYRAAQILTSRQIGNKGMFCLEKIETGEDDTLIVAKTVVKCTACEDEVQLSSQI